MGLLVLSYFIINNEKLYIYIYSLTVVKLFIQFFIINNYKVRFFAYENVKWLLKQWLSSFTKSFSLCLPRFYDFFPFSYHTLFRGWGFNFMKKTFNLTHTISYFYLILLYSLRFTICVILMILSSVIFHWSELLSSILFKIEVIHFAAQFKS